ncbi:hypothetical protein TNCV_4871791 [Trichonephila clavipes]|nr:hypothetical protein TNCV_4871791 [Trichonephila clavipes]
MLIFNQSIPSGTAVSDRMSPDVTTGVVGTGFESRGRHVPSRHGDILNSHRAASPLVRLVEGEERWESLTPLPGCPLSKLGWNQGFRQVTLSGVGNARC